MYIQRWYKDREKTCSGQCGQSLTQENFSDTQWELKSGYVGYVCYSVARAEHGPGHATPSQLKSSHASVAPRRAAPRHSAPRSGRGRRVRYGRRVGYVGYVRHIDEWIGRASSKRSHAEQSRVELRRARCTRHRLASSASSDRPAGSQQQQKTQNRAQIPSFPPLCV